MQLGLGKPSGARVKCSGETEDKINEEDDKRPDVNPLLSK
jgi:hypothetical protein